MTGDPDHTSRTWLVRTAVALLGVALVVVLAVVLVDRGDEEEPGSTAPASPSATAEETPRDAPAPGQPNDGSGDSESPSGGGTGSTEAPDDAPAPSPGEADNRPAVEAAFSEDASPEDGVSVSVARVEAVRSQAELPGETSRPALRITVRVQNDTGASLDIGGALTNLYFGRSREAATLVQRPGGRPFPASVPAGGTATSVVVYNVPPDQRARVVLEVSLDATIRRVEFNGSCTDGC